MNTIRLALRMLSRDARAGELSVLIAALVLAAASVGTVGFFADRVKGALTRQANLLLGADLMVSADRPLPPDYAREAAARGLATVPVIRFNSMVQPAGGSEAVLADVKAVGATYPLRGAVLLAVPNVPEGRPASLSDMAAREAKEAEADKQAAAARKAEAEKEAEAAGEEKP